MRQNVREKALVQQFMYIMKTEKRYLHIQALLAGEAKETKAETKVNSALKTTYYEAYSAERKALKSKESDNIEVGPDNTFDARA